MVVLDRHRLAHDLCLEVPALGEQRAQGAIDHPRSQRRLLAGATFAPEEGAGDLPRRVVALLDIDRQRQEVHIPQVPDRRRGEHHRVAGSDNDGSARLSGELAGLEGDLVAAYLHRNAAYVKHAHLIFSLRPPG